MSKVQLQREIAFRHKVYTCVIVVQYTCVMYFKINVIVFICTIQVKLFIHKIIKYTIITEPYCPNIALIHVQYIYFNSIFVCKVHIIY